MIAEPVVILGVPRSGTTWIEHVLGADPAVEEVHEPDNETERPWALVAKRGLGRFPLLVPGQRVRRYETLWSGAFGGGWSSPVSEIPRALHRRTDRFGLAEAAVEPPRRLSVGAGLLGMLDRPLPALWRPRPHTLVKSVHAALSAEWLCERFAPRVLVVRRDPFEVLASWQSLASSGDNMGSRLEFAGVPDYVLSPPALRALSSRHGAPPAAPLAGRAWLVCALIAELDAFAARRPETVVIDFDAACTDPRGVLSSAAVRLGLPWGHAAEAMVDSLNEPGEGWETHRVTVAVPGAWRRRLSVAEIAEIDASLSQFLAN